jgi:hypothetical protein
MKSQKPLSRKDNIVVQELDGEVMIYDLAKDKAFCLNETSALVWQACDGSRSVTEISEFVSNKLNSPASDDLVWFAIDELKKENLIETNIVSSEYFEGMSRRQVIKKVGLSTLLAIPVIAALSAPVAAQTTSICAPFGTCNCVMAVFMTDETGGTCNSGACMTNGTGCICADIICIPNGNPGEFTCGNGMCAAP